MAGARGISCQMILIGSCRAIQRRPKKAKKKKQKKSSGGVKQAQKKGNEQKKRKRERAHMRERARVARNKTRVEYIDLPPVSPSSRRLDGGHRRWDTRPDLLKIAGGVQTNSPAARRSVNNAGQRGDSRQGTKTGTARGECERELLFAEYLSRVMPASGDATTTPCFIYPEPRVTAYRNLTSAL